MALVFCDGFDHYSSSDMLKKWTSLTNVDTLGVVDIDTQWARPPGGMGIRCSATGNTRGVLKQLPSTYQTLIVGFNYLYESSGTPGTIFALKDAGTAQVELKINSSGQPYVTRNSSTTLGTASNVMLPNVWYHVEWKVKIDPTVGTYEVKINGSSWVSATGANTRNSSNSYVNQAVLSFYDSGPVPRFDDLYVLDTSGSVANDFIGPQKIYTLLPNGAGSSAQWTGNYAANYSNVNEMAMDSEWTANQSNTAGNIDLFTCDDVPTGTVYGVQQVTVARQDAGTQRTLRNKVSISGTSYNGATQNVQSSFQCILDASSVSPATSSAWTAAEVNGSEFGYELVT